MRAFIPVSPIDEEAEFESNEPIAIESPIADSVRQSTWHFPKTTEPDPKMIYAFLGLFAVVGILGVRMFTLTPRVVALTGTLPPIAASALPSEIGEWRVGEFHEVKRDRGDS